MTVDCRRVFIPLTSSVIGHNEKLVYTLSVHILTRVSAFSILSERHTIYRYAVTVCALDCRLDQTLDSRNNCMVY